MPIVSRTANYSMRLVLEFDNSTDYQSGTGNAANLILLYHAQSKSQQSDDIIEQNQAFGS